MEASQNSPKQYDAIVVGAGFTGLYLLYRLREMGLKVMAIEAGSGVGGTWYWNRYPGARVDSRIPGYEYTFSTELIDEWDWSEAYPAQPETERYLNFMADKFALKKDIRFDARVTAARFDEAARHWHISTDQGDALEARFFVCCTGILSSPIVPFEGQEQFSGLICHTARWPREPVDFSDKRVGIVGNGATGMQVIQTIAPQVGHLKVFQRTAQYAIDIKNPRFSDADRAALRARYPEIIRKVEESFGGLYYEDSVNYGSFHDHSPQRRQEIYEAIWASGSLRFWLGIFPEVITDEKANAEVADFVRAKIRGHVKDPQTAEQLMPDYLFGTRRLPLQYGYYDAFNRDNVELVDARTNPIDRITANGLRMADGEEHELDILIFATGFDAGTGALSRIDIRGRDGQSLKEKWQHDLRTAMGLQVHGFPNLFTPGAPLAPITAFCNVPACSQHQGDWIADCIGYLREHDFDAIEPTAATEQQWVAHHDQVANATLFPKTGGWYMGTNVAGKTRRLLSYIGGLPAYRERCRAVAESGYEGFTLS